MQADIRDEVVGPSRAVRTAAIAVTARARGDARRDTGDGTAAADGTISSGRTVARGTILGIAAQAWHLVAAFLLYAFLARKLGPTLFGRWRLVLSILNWLELVVNSGLVKVSVKAIAEAPTERPRTVRASYIGQGVLAAALFAASMLAAGPIASALGDPSLAFLLRLSSLDIPLYAAFMVAASILLGVQRFERQAFGMAVYALAKFIAIGSLVMVGFSVPGALIGNALASVVGFAVTYTPWRGAAGWKSAAVEARSMGVASVPFLTLNLVEGVYTTADLWAVQGFAGSGVLVGLYGAATALAAIPEFLFVALGRTVFPSIARAQADGDRELESKYARQAVRLALLVTILGVAVIAATGGQVLRLLYGAAFVGAALPLTILMVAASGRSVQTTCTEILMAQDRKRPALGILGVSVTLELALLAMLTAPFGLIGASASAAVVAVAGGAVTAFTLRRLLSSRVVVTLARAVLAAGVVGGVLAALRPAPAALLVAYPAAALGYVGILRLLRELDGDDLGALLSVFERRRAARVEGTADAGAVDPAEDLE